MLERKTTQKKTLTPIQGTNNHATGDSTELTGQGPSYTCRTPTRRHDAEGAGQGKERSKEAKREEWLATTHTHADPTRNTKQSNCTRKIIKRLLFGSGTDGFHVDIRYISLLHTSDSALATDTITPHYVHQYTSKEPTSLAVVSTYRSQSAR